METLVDKARTYILALKEAGDFSYEDMATISGESQSTIRNFCNGTTAKNPGFPIIAKLVISMGGDFNELIEALMQKPIEEMKELYNTREIEK